MDGLSGWCSRRVCVVSLGGEANRLHGVVCWGGYVERWCKMEIYCKYRCFRLLNLVLPVEKVMLSIANLMVDGGCIATTGGRRLFCILIINSICVKSFSIS
jgi:hypothetical protein